MSNNHNIPGLRKIVNAKPEYGIATRVSGRNLATLNYIASLEAERRGVSIEVSAVFRADGSLDHVTVRDDTLPGLDGYRPDGDLFPGNFVALPPGADEAWVLDEASYNKLFNEV